MSDIVVCFSAVLDTVVLAIWKVSVLCVCECVCVWFASWLFARLLQLKTVSQPPYIRASKMKLKSFIEAKLAYCSTARLKLWMKKKKKNGSRHPGRNGKNVFLKMSDDKYPSFKLCVSSFLPNRFYNWSLVSIQIVRLNFIEFCFELSENKKLWTFLCFRWK